MPARKPKPPPDDPEQSKRFIDMADKPNFNHLDAMENRRRIPG